MTLISPKPLQSWVDKLASRSLLGEEERKAILGLPAHRILVQCNRDFVRLGERVEHASLIVDGLVGRFSQNSDGGRQITAVHVSGDMADLHSVVAPEAASALQPLSATTILKIPHSALRELARRFPAIAEAFWRECVVDAAVLSEWVVNVGRRDARARAAHLLCEMACRYEAIGERVGLQFDFPVTQTHLADMLALTPVHVNRTLQVLRRDELAQVRSRTVHILNWQGIVAAGEFDPTYLRIGQSAKDNATLREPRLAAR